MIKNKAHGNIPWHSAEDLYKTINSIKAGNTPWKTYKFCYAGPKPSGPIPQWMEQEYELNAWDALVLIEHQLATSDFDGNFDYAPYQEFGPDGEHVWSNLMSSYWAWKQGVCPSLTCSANTLTNNLGIQNNIAQDCGIAAHKAMLVPVIAGSDKTTVSVAMGHQEYHLVYNSIGNISNTAHWAHRNGILPVAFLPIPKSRQPFSIFFFLECITHHAALSGEQMAKEEAGFPEILPTVISQMP